MSTSLSFALPPVPPVRPTSRDSERIIVCQGMLSEYGWIEALQVIDHPCAGAHGCRIYITSEDLRDGETLRPGDVVEFDLFEDDDGHLAAEDCHRRVAIDGTEAAKSASESYTQALAAWKKTKDTTLDKIVDMPAPQHRMSTTAPEFVPATANPWTCAAINAAFLGDSDSDSYDEEDEAAKPCNHVEPPPGLEHLCGAAAKHGSTGMNQGTTVHSDAAHFTNVAQSDENMTSSRLNTAAKDFVPSSRFNSAAKEFVPSGSPTSWAIPMMVATFNAAFLAESDASDSDDEDTVRPAPSSSSCPSSPESSYFVPTYSKEVHGCGGMSSDSISTSSGASPRTSDSEAEFEKAYKSIQVKAAGEVDSDDPEDILALQCHSNIPSKKLSGL